MTSDRWRLESGPTSWSWTRTRSMTFATCARSRRCTCGAPKWIVRHCARGGRSNTRSVLATGLKQLDRIAVRILDLDLTAARPDFHLIAEMDARAFQPFDA